jgi:hypothetical protein
LCSSDLRYDPMYPCRRRCFSPCSTDNVCLLLCRRVASCLCRLMEAPPLHSTIYVNKQHRSCGN